MQTIVTVQVFYYLPDYQSIIGSFLWQTIDIRPTYPRIGHFLEFWRREVDAVIQDVVICDSQLTQNKWSNGIILPHKYG